MFEPRFRLAALLPLVALLLASRPVVAADAEPINGVPGLGVLTVDQVTFPGAHNAGAGYRGQLVFWPGVAAPSGFYRNQTKSFTEQLDLGVRYLDIDTMWVPKQHTRWWAGGAWTGHGNAYAGPLTDLVAQLRAWLDQPAHAREVVIVEFHSDIYEGELHAAEIAADLADLFRPLLAEPRAGDGVRLGSRDAQGRWPTLGDAVRTNRRLFVLMHQTLHDRLPVDSPAKAEFIRTTDDAPADDKPSLVSVRNAYAYRVVTSAEDCRAALLGHAAKCDSPAPFVRMSCFAPFGLEMGEMAEKSAPHLADACLAADRLRARHQRPVNFLLADRIGSGGEGVGENSLFAVARRLNEANLRRFAPR